jgi:pectate lyase
MKKNGVRIAVMFVLSAAVVFAQNPSSAVWSLTANQIPAVAGDITATNQQLSAMQVSYSSSVQRSSPAGAAGTWSAESAENPGRFMQFIVSPKQNFDLTVNTISLKLYVNSGSGMSVNVYYSNDSTFAVKTKIGPTLTLSNTVPAAPNVSAAPNIVVTAGQSIYLRVYPWYNASTTGKYVITNTVTIAGTTLNAIAPLITTTVTSIPEFPATIAGGMNDGSVYAVSAVNLISDLIVAAPVGFHISKDSVQFFDSVIFIPSAGSVAEAKVYTRFAPSAAAGLVEDVIVHKSADAQSKFVTVSAVSLAAEPTMQSSVNIGSVTGNSITVSADGGNGNRRIVVVRKDSAVTLVPVDGNEFSGVDSIFTAALEQGNGNKVVYDGPGSSVVVTGLSVASAYHFAVFEYNIGTGNSHNYKNSGPGTGNATTQSVAGLSVAPGSISFGSVVINTVSKEKSFELSGSFLNPSSGNIVIAAPAGFQVSSTSGSGFDSAVSVSYNALSVNALPIFVRFNPTSLVNYSGTVTISGGGALPVSVNVAGDGVNHVVVPDSVPFGFASLGGGTTGGAGGTAIIITSGQQLADIMLPREKTSDPGNPIILYISGTLSGFGDVVSIKRTKNVSVIGLGADAKVQGFGFKIVESSNIIVRNITFADAKAGEKDAVSVEESHNVWIDHCSFTDSPSIDLSGGSHDGQLDVKKGSFNVTLSYNYFTNHRKTCLLGHSTSETGDAALRVTYYRNWFDGTYSRHPRARYGKAHILNNLYSSVGVVGADQGGYAVGSTCGASLLVEANYFEGTSRPTLISQVNDPLETLSGDPIGYLKAMNNYAVNSGPIVESLSGYNFDPSESYSYTPLDAQLVKDVVTASAGAGKLDGGGPTTVTVHQGHVAAGFQLLQNFPNPFNPSTTIHFSAGSARFATLTVYSAIGQKVATLFSGAVEAHRIYSVTFNGSTLSSGMYFSILDDGVSRQAKKMLLQK